MTASPPPLSPEPEVRRATAVNPDDPDAAPPNLDLRHGENAEVKREVLARVDLMPEVSQDNKDKLYAAVDRARGMGAGDDAAFDKGRVVVNKADVEKLGSAGPPHRTSKNLPTIRRWCSSSSLRDQKGAREGELPALPPARP